MWTVLLAAVASSLGGYWLVRGIERDDIVNRGSGVVEQPNITCSSNYRGSPVCTRNVEVFVNATHQLLSQTDVDGLYARAESAAGKSFEVQAVDIDTTNNQVNRVVYGGTAYQLEPTQGSFLTLGIIVLVADAGAVGFLIYLVKRRRGRGRGRADRRPKAIAGA